MKLKYLFWLACILASCSKPEENIIRIPSEFFISIREHITYPGVRSLYLDLSSIQSKYCTQDSLVYKLQRTGNTLNITVFDSYKTSGCLTQLDPLDGQIPLPSFTDSLYLNIRLGSASEIKACITEDSKKYLFNIIQGKGLISKYEQTYKIPDKLLWGYAYPVAVDPICESMIHNLVKEIEFECSTNWLPEGYYSSFSIEENNALIFSEHPSVAGKLLNFYFTHSWSEDEMNDFFQKLSLKYSKLVGFTIHTGTGKVYISN